MKLKFLVGAGILACALVGCSTANVHQTTNAQGTRTVIRASNGATATVTTANGGNVTVNTMGM